MHLSRLMTKPTKWLCAQQRQISLGIHPVWSESLLCAQWVAKDPSFLHADSEDSDQTGQMPRLIRVFAGHTCHFVGFVVKRLNLKDLIPYGPFPYKMDHFVAIYFRKSLPSCLRSLKILQYKIFMAILLWKYVSGKLGNIFEYVHQQNLPVKEGRPPLSLQHRHTAACSVALSPGLAAVSSASLGKLCLLSLNHHWPLSYTICHEFFLFL